MSNGRLLLSSGVAAGVVYFGCWAVARWRPERTGTGGTAELPIAVAPAGRSAGGTGKEGGEQSGNAAVEKSGKTPARPGGSRVNGSGKTPPVLSAEAGRNVVGGGRGLGIKGKAGEGEDGKEHEYGDGQDVRVSLADLLGAGVDLSDPAQRAALVEKLRLSEERAKAEANALADKEELPKRVTRPDGSVMELMKLDAQGQPKYYGTRNVNAAISSGANLLQALPYSLSGTGVVIGLWDGGAALAAHQEFGGRVTSKDGAAADDHATHVCGTLVAAGVVPAAKGMAPAATVDSYDWNSDLSEMTSRGASYPGEAGKIYVSNHSYGQLSGWNYTGYPSPEWTWYGSGTSATGAETDFGRYSAESRDNDALEVSLPYYLIVRAAGNDRTDDPAAGDPVSLSPSTSSSRVVKYDPALHPAGDGLYKNGYDTISYDELAKNILTVGAVTDAVSGGLRSAAQARVLPFSGWGPTDDGRIKPDLVADGDQLYSSIAASTSSYATYSGTSMATPATTGSAALLVQYFGRLFPGAAMRASTLKGLLIHTADNLGTPGPDYQTGWGLINVKAAADLLNSWHDHPAAPQVVEDRVVTGVGSREYSLAWDGVSPIRATLCWTDPAGTVTSSSDSRTARLVNNLDLSVTGPAGTIYSPWVMPYVGSWTPAMLAAPAITGKNNTDNVEQVLVAAPGAPGVYTVKVSVDGSLTTGAQSFSLLLSGGTASGTIPAPVLTAVSPASGISGTVTLSLSGSGFQLGSRVTLEKAGRTTVTATGLEPVSDNLRCRLALNGMTSGGWDVVLTNPDGQRGVLAAAFTVTGPLWEDTLENGAAGWTHAADFGTADSWTLSTTRSASATHSFYSSMPALRNVAELYSPPVEIPAEAGNLRLTFQHSYSLSASRAGGVLEYSLDGGTVWTDVAAADSGASFSSGGYNATLKSSGSPTSPTTANPLTGRSGWAGSATSFTPAVLDLTDGSKFAGHTLRLRWRLATGKSSSGSGGSGYWYIDDVVLAGTVPPAVIPPPTLTAAASALPRTVIGTSTALSVSASDGGDGGSLIYTWSSTADFQAPVRFGDNGTSTASATTATFSKAGHYVLSVSVRGAENLSVTSSVEVTVEPTASGLTVTPEAEPVIVVPKGGSLNFSVSAVDQFGLDMETPLAVAWSATGGTITGSGLFSAGQAAGVPFTVTATAAEPAPASGGTLTASSGGTVTGQRLRDWSTSYFGAAAAGNIGLNLEDSDQDSLPNLLEYALGTDPLTPDRPPEPVYDGKSLTMTFTRPRDLPDVNYEVQATSDLKNWEAVPLEVITEGDPEEVRARLTIPGEGTRPYFMRLKVSAAE